MHWRAYDRLRREWEAIRDATNADCEAGLRRLVARTDRLLAERRAGG